MSGPPIKQAWRLVSQPGTARLLAVGGTMVILLAAFFAICVAAPAGFSPRLGSERDVTGFFPWWHITRPFSAPGSYRISVVVAIVSLWITYVLALLVVHRRRSAALLPVAIGITCL